MKKPIQTCEIKKYLTKVKMSSSRRAKYFNRYNGKGVNRNYDYDSLTGKYAPIAYDFGNRNLPAPKSKLVKLYDGSGWSWNKKGYLQDENGDRVVANPRSVGTARYETLSGNSFSSGYGAPYIRHKLVKALKNSYRPHIKKQMRPFKNNEYPLVVTWDMYTVVGRFDMSNFWFYYKYFEDALVDTTLPTGGNVLVDDDIKYVTHPASPRIIPVENWSDRKFIFRFYKDERKIIKTSKHWK